MRELCTDSVPCVLTGLIAACNVICDTTVLSLLVDKVLKLSASKSPLVRIKAIITLDRFCQLSPALWQEVEKVVVTRLCDEDPAVVAAAIQVLAKYLSIDPEVGLVVIEPVLHVQQQILDNRLPADFTYRGKTSPWVQINVLRILSKFKKLIGENKPLHSKVSEIIEKQLDIEFSKETIDQIILSECIKAVIHLGSMQQFIPTALKILSKFLQSKDNCVKHTGLGLLEQIFRTHPPSLNSSQEESLLHCLEHPDPTIQSKTLDLLTVLANPANLKRIVEAILVHLKKTGSALRSNGQDRSATKNGDQFNVVTSSRQVGSTAVTSGLERRLGHSDELVLRVYSVINSMSEDLDWKTSSTIRLIQSSFGSARSTLVENLKFLLSPVHLEKDPASELELNKVRRKISRLLNNLVGSGVRNPVILELLVWTTAEFSTVENYEESTNSLLHWAETLTSNPQFLLQIVSALLTVRIRTGKLGSQGLQFIKENADAEDKTIRTRAEQGLRLLEQLDLAGLGLANTEETSTEEEQTSQHPSMDLTLSFLDELVFKSLCEGGESYIPACLRRKPVKPGAEDTPVNIAPYSRLRQDTANSNRSMSSISPTSSTHAPRVWTLEGRIQEEQQDLMISAENTPSPELSSPPEETTDPLYEGW